MNFDVVNIQFQFSKKWKQITQALALSSVLALTACGASVDADFAKDAKQIVSSFDSSMKRPDFDSEAILSEAQFFFDKWGKKPNKQETEVLKHISQMSGYATLYSVEKEESKRSEIRQKYITEVEAINKIIK
ncbi:hypothetical protein [Paenibacillus sp. Root444D2]|uniref:hypothetical protein n=1 Tax=Paenibacillus sp. Root444D2 TaxID=1736538 RepID=UPI00070BD2CE|nr:hypothetical protein [Paenibacillus sp. Root444D2]KQX69247.1 hypothetical protein ASD40_01735 [Paenibacillus sp. Root444D2]